MLTLSDLEAGLSDLFDRRRTYLRKAKAGKYYEPMLKEQLAAIKALPPALVAGAPDAALDATDAQHDGFGAAIYFTTEVYLRLPGASPEIVDSATRVREAFIPTLVELGASYATEAERALERRPLLASLRADLERFPMAGGGTLADAAKAFLDAGQRLHDMLESRADVPAASAREAAKVRSSTVGMLSRLRTDVTAEVQKNKRLPRDLDARIFGRFDELLAARRERAEPSY
jgi:hypothetical protein